MVDPSILNKKEFLLSVPLYEIINGKINGKATGIVGNEPVYGLYGIWAESTLQPPKGAIVFTFTQVDPVNNPTAFHLSFENYVVQNTDIGLVGSPPDQGTIFNIQSLEELDGGIYICNIVIESNPIQYIINNNTNGLGGVYNIPEGNDNPYFTLVPKSIIHHLPPN